MRASAVIGLCLLLLQHRDDASFVAQAATFLSTIFLLLQDENPEQTRAVLGVARVFAAVLSVEALCDRPSAAARNSRSRMDVSDMDAKEGEERPEELKGLGY